MDSKVALSERANFSDRLKVALADAGLPSSPSAFTRAFNARADGAAVSIYAARKWLTGEAIPTHEKVVIIATWLGVNPSWLRFGDPDAGGLSDAVIPEASISTPALALINDIVSLPEPAQQTIREIVDAFLRNFGETRVDRNNS
jgi:hypothetical protein